jgi:predicted peptidase
MQNTNAVTAQLNTMAAANAACCCETQRQIERGFADTNYNMATQACETRQAIATSTRDIIDSNNAGVRSILDFLTQDKIATLTAENQSLKLAASQARQNNYLIEQLKPCPVPAYVVANPNCCTPAYNFNTCLA